VGLLVARKYPTRLLLEAADHTYVECGNGGKAWGCWGGKSGGSAFHSGAGSTLRADSIAQPNERANITCYLINGVCHQAANRILLPAGILVTGARGYSVSAAIFGTYGRVGTWPCQAPFDAYTGVTGDLSACLAAAPRTAAAGRYPKLPSRKGEDNHIRAIKRAYHGFDPERATPLDAMKFHVDLFEREVRFRLGRASLKAIRALRLAKERVELEHHRLTESLGSNAMSPAEFIKAFNEMTLRFQDQAAEALNDAQYERLLGLERDERVVLADPDIVASLYGARVVEEVYGAI
jgi:hypothetical protein